MAAASRVIKIIPNRTAFFVCDIQERLRDTIANFPHVVSTSVKMVRMAGILQIPVVYTEQHPKVFKSTVPEIQSQIDELSTTLKHGPFAKTKFGMVIPEVENILAEKDIRSVVIFGVESHICVLQTALDLLESGRDVHVLADGVSSANSQEVNLALERMKQAGAQITTSESLLYQIMGDASGPTFKSFATILKEEKDATTEALKALFGDSRSTVRSAL
ncbi:Isochorismatase domain-containing protein 1 [Tulasnella sp. 419]|nr:Isochorismatase domain-containing protein 1 [Tulasnella sp. 419]